jgi:hypothetical protein
MDPSDGAERSRGQIILVTGFALAVSFVALALVMNSVIYTENLATRSEAAKASDAVKIRSDMANGTEVLVRSVNENNDTSYAALHENVTNGLDHVSASLRRLHGVNGQATAISVEVIRNGTMSRQTNGSRNFTNVDGNPDWTLLDDVEDVETARFKVNQMEDPDLLGLPAGDPARFSFVAENTSTGDTWKVIVENGTGGFTGDHDVFVEEGLTSDYCGTESFPFWVNITDGGYDCGGTTYELGSSMGDVDLIRYTNGDHVEEGRYTHFVQNESDSLGTSNYDASTKSPFFERRVYNVTGRVEYEEQRMRYGSNVTVGPGGTDD